jgi:import inner membrane translocase subunit TIM54
MEEVVKRRRETEEALKLTAQSNESTLTDGSTETSSDHSSNPFASPSMEDMMNKKGAKEVVSDGILAIGRNAYREVLSGLSKGCDASLAVVEEAPATPAVEGTSDAIGSATVADAAVDEKEQPTSTEVIKEEEYVMPVDEMTEQTVESYFSLPDQFSPIMYIPHVNIIGWSNIPYRLYMWYADHKRIEEVGKYVVAAVLNEKRPMEKKDADLGQAEKKYWLGDEEVEELLKNDTPIEIDERIIDKLTTYTSEDLP